VTKLERINPALTALAAEVMPDQKIRYRAGAYWLGDLQLTYAHETTDGTVRELGAPHSAENAALAERILRKCLAAREQPTWGSRWERQRRILIGLHDEAMPAFRPEHWCHWGHESLDDGWLYGSPGSGTFTAGLRLVGDENDAKADGATMRDAIETLWLDLSPDGERPPWHAGEDPR